VKQNKKWNKIYVASHSLGSCVCQQNIQHNMTWSLQWLIYSESPQDILHLGHRQNCVWNGKRTQRSPQRDWPLSFYIVTLGSWLGLCSVGLWNGWSNRDFSFRISYSEECIRIPISSSLMSSTVAGPVLDSILTSAFQITKLTVMVYDPTE
jgi:hypothetical protein